MQSRHRHRPSPVITSEDAGDGLHRTNGGPEAERGGQFKPPGKFHIPPEFLSRRQFRANRAGFRARNVPFPLCARASSRFRAQKVANGERLLWRNPGVSAGVVPQRKHHLEGVGCPWRERREKHRNGHSPKRWAVMRAGGRQQPTARVMIARKVKESAQIDKVDADPVW